MKKFFIRKTLFLITAAAVICEPGYSQKKDTVEMTAQGILARVDRVMQYPEGEIQGRIKHITPDGKAYDIDFKGCITRNDFLFFTAAVPGVRALKFSITWGVRISGYITSMPSRCFTRWV